MRARAAAAAALLTSGVLTGCVTTPQPQPTALVFSTDTADDANGIERLAATAAIRKVLAAVDAAGSAHLSGSYTAPADGEGEESAGRTITLDVRGSASRFTARLTTGALDGTFVRLGETVYVAGSAELTAALGVPAVAGGYTSFRSDDARLASWLTFTDIPALLRSILDTETAGVRFAVGSTDPAAKAMQLEVSAQGTITGTVTVPTVGPALPSALAVTDPTGSATLSFSDWGKPAEVAKPDGAIPAG